MAAVEERRTVSLTVPAKPEYLVLARLALSAVCRLTPLEADEVADLKLAVTEAAGGFVSEGSRDAVAFSFLVRDDRLVLEARGSAQDGSSAEDRELARAIISATVDECEIGPTATRLVKYLDGFGQ